MKGELILASNLRIIRIRDLLKFTPQGNLDLSTMKEGIKTIASFGPFSEHDVFVDTRGTESHLSVTDVWVLAKELATVVQAGTSKGFRAKISVLCPVEHFDHAQFFELCAQNHGLNVQAFTSFEELFEWLSGSSK